MDRQMEEIQTPEGMDRDRDGCMHGQTDIWEDRDGRWMHGQSDGRNRLRRKVARTIKQMEYTKTEGCTDDQTDGRDRDGSMHRQIHKWERQRQMEALTIIRVQETEGR